MGKDTLEEQLSDFFWAAETIRRHQQHGGGEDKSRWDDMSHALWLVLAIYRNAENPKLQRKVHDFLVYEVGLPEHLICQLSMLAPAAAPAAEVAIA